MSRLRRYLSLWVLLAVALLPLLVALASYFGGVGVPSGRVNQGQLVLDQPPLAQWQLVDQQGRPWSGAGQWQLLQVATACDAPCRAWRYYLVQLHKALGRERHRVAAQWVDAAAEDAMDGLLRRSQQPLAAGIWLADPLGNLVLYYRFDQPPQALLKDLKRLLKVSKVG